MPTYSAKYKHIKTALKGWCKTRMIGTFLQVMCYLKTFEMNSSLCILNDRSDCVVRVGLFNEPPPPKKMTSYSLTNGLEWSNVCFVIVLVL